MVTGIFDIVLLLCIVLIVVAIVLLLMCIVQLSVLLLGHQDLLNLENNNTVQQFCNHSIC